MRHDPFDKTTKIPFKVVGGKPVHFHDGKPITELREGMVGDIVVQNYAAGEPRRAGLAEAIAVAAEAHANQTDKAGAPYILHPLRVMQRLDTEAEMTAAVLHDVVEDSGWTLDGLRAAGFSEEVVQAVDCLTRRAGEDYDAFVGRVRQDPIARRVKLADVEDNLNITRLLEVTDKDVERLRKYHRVRRLLRGGTGL